MDYVSAVERLFAEAPDRFEELRRNLVTDRCFHGRLDSIREQKRAACRVLRALDWFAQTGPRDAQPLPLSYDEREDLKRGGLPLQYIVAWFARSLAYRDYAFEGHPSLERYACGVLASPHAPDLPAPAATPRTLAIVGCGMRWSAVATSLMWRMLARPWVFDEPIPETSAPEQKSPPAPVSTSTRSSALAPTSRNTASSSSHIAALAAFLRSGRVIVTVTIPSARSTSSVSKLIRGTILTAVGFNPYRRFRARPTDYVLVVVAIALALALVVWAFAG